MSTVAQRAQAHIARLSSGGRREGRFARATANLLVRILYDKPDTAKLFETHGYAQHKLWGFLDDWQKPVANYFNNCDLLLCFLSQIDEETAQAIIQSLQE
jgi:hypothetical protein